MPVESIKMQISKPYFRCYQITEAFFRDPPEELEKNTQVLIDRAGKKVLIEQSEYTRSTAILTDFIVKEQQCSKWRVYTEKAFYAGFEPWNGENLTTDGFEKKIPELAQVVADDLAGRFDELMAVYEEEKEGEGEKRIITCLDDLEFGEFIHTAEQSYRWIGKYYDQYLMWIIPDGHQWVKGCITSVADAAAFWDSILWEGVKADGE